MVAPSRSSWTPTRASARASRCSRRASTCGFRSSISPPSAWRPPSGCGTSCGRRLWCARAPGSAASNWARSCCRPSRRCRGNTPRSPSGSAGSPSGRSWRTAPQCRWARSSSWWMARSSPFSSCASSTSRRPPAQPADPMPVREDLLQPIPGLNPAGTNLRYDPIYDKIKEARREEEDVEQGEWKRARKVADWPLVIKLASDALTTKSKDLHIAGWLTEGLLKQEGLGGLRTGLGLLHALLDTFWDHLYPEAESGDVELRASPLNWVGRYLDAGVKSVPVTKAGHDLFKYLESRAVGYEADAKGDEKKQAAREAALGEHKLAAEEFDKAFDATPKPWYKQLMADLEGCLKAVQGLDELCQQKFGDASPSFGTLVQALEEVQHLARQLLEKK